VSEKMNTCTKINGGERVKRIWEIKQATEPNILDMYIYGDVKGDGYDWWMDEVIESETSANHFRNELAKYPQATKINIYINSYGGSVFEGTAIYSQLKRHSAEKIVYVDGFACSVASIIAMAGDKIIMPKNTMMMIHNAWNIVLGNSKELRKAADDLDTIMKGNRQAYLEKANGKITEEKLMELLENETWLTADQCFEYGLCDSIGSEEVDLTQANEMLKNVNQTLEQKLNFNKVIAAQIREMAKPVAVEPTEPEEPSSPPEPEPEPEQKRNNVLNLMSAIVKNNKI